MILSILISPSAMVLAFSSLALARNSHQQFSWCAPSWLSCRGLVMRRELDFRAGLSEVVAGWDLDWKTRTQAARSSLLGLHSVGFTEFLYLKNVYKYS